MLLLASSSPRRREILSRAGYKFIVVPANADEQVPPGMPPGEIVETLARRKAKAVAQGRPGDTILAADTIVVLDGTVLGKPRDPTEACAMLARLSGRVHTVYTGYCVRAGDRIQTGCESTEVEFYPLSDQEILDYVNTGEPMDKAGAYGIQGLGALLVRRIRGDFYNVMGLPIGAVHRILRDFLN